MDLTIEEYINSLIPDKIPKKRKSLIYDELYCHINDKADFYIDIGYGADEAISKAMKDMGDKQEMKDEIKGSFDKLYRERTFWGIGAFLLVWVLNVLSVFLGLWVWSFDYNDDPTVPKVFASFAMVTAVFALMKLAAYKGYKKTLAGFAVGNLTVVLSVGCMFYPQCATTALGYCVEYFIDSFTPISLYDSILYYDMGVPLNFICLIFFTLYAAAWAIRINRGHEMKVKSAFRRHLSLILAAVLAVCTCSFYPTAHQYCKDYPIYFDYLSGITEKSAQTFERATQSGAYHRAKAIIESQGYTNVIEYADRLERLNKKHLLADFAKHNFIFGDDCEIYYDFERKSNNNGFIFLIQGENDRIKFIGEGNGSPFYDEKEQSFRFWNDHKNADIDSVMEYFFGIQKGMPEEEIMSYYGNNGHGVIYSRFITFDENGNEAEHYYRVYCNGTVKINEKNENMSVYIELDFADGILRSGQIYYPDIDESLSYANLKV